MIHRSITLVMALLTCGLLYAADEPPKTLIFGLIEPAELVEHNVILKAKMDTGADNSSLNAIQIEEYEKDDQKRVRFKLPLRKGNNVKLIPFDLPVEKHIHIKTRDNELEGDTRGSFRRPLIILNVCIGDQVKGLRVNLADRQNFKYHLLIGRLSILKFNAIVDPSKERLTTLSCPKHDKPPE